MKPPAAWPIDNATSAERAYRRAGVPNLIEGYAAAEDILTRLAPWLAVWFVANLASATVGQRGWTRAIVIVVVVAAALGVYAANQVRRGLPALALPRRVGPWQLVAFFAVPAALRLVGGSDGVAGVFVDVVIDAVVLGVMVLGTSFGVGSMIGWAVRQMRTHAESTIDLVMKTLPLVLITVLFFFLTAETWQLLHHLHFSRYLGGLSAFVTFGSVLLVAAVARSSTDLTVIGSHEELCTLASEAGAVGLDAADGFAASITDSLIVATALPRRVRINIALVLFFSQAVQVALMFIIVTSALVGIGFLVVRPATMQAWLGEPPHYLFASDGARDTLREVMTAEVFKVAGFIGAFAALQFAVQIAASDADAPGVLAETQRNVRRAVAIRRLRDCMGEIAGGAAAGGAGSTGGQSPTSE